MKHRRAIASGVVLVLAVVAGVAEYRARTVSSEQPSQEMEFYRSGTTPESIPPIDAPVFISVAEADETNDDTGLGISLEVEGDARFYPFSVLVWHFVVNDTIAQKPVLIVYDPLSGYAGAFERPVVDGSDRFFEISGLVSNSMAVLQDRTSMELMVPIKRKLTALASQQYSFGDWKKAYPRGKVLSQETGFARDYRRNPYIGYDEQRTVLFPVDHRDERLHPKELVYGYVGADGEAKAYPRTYIEDEKTITDTVKGKKVTVSLVDQNVKVLAEDTAGAMQEIPTHPLYWFAWVATYPETEVYDPLGETVDSN